MKILSLAQFPTNQYPIYWTEVLVDDRGEVITLVPFAVIGLELFSSDLFHFFVDAKYFYSTRLIGKTKEHTFRDWVLSAGITTNW